MFGFEQKKDMEIASRAMTLTGVEHLAHRTMEQLSGGELQRVFIARALCQEPGIILLDEPTACLDIAHQVMLMDLMEKLREEIGFTVIMVSHDVNLAAMYATRLLLLNSGIITEVGKPRDILKREALENTYKCKLLVDKNPFGDLPRITPLPEKFKGVYV
jgi:iron complex transport system ATP-binding protein